MNAGPQALIEVEGVSKSFGPQRVLANCSFSVGKGETLVVIGSSGGGKSVLLKLISGLMAPDSGVIRVAGRDRGALSEEEAENLSLRSGFLFQSSALFDSLTVGENVAFALERRGKHGREELRAIAEEKLNLVGLRGVQDRRPAELSGGMRKRVGLARAIALEPELIFYDEPTTGLDPIMADSINDLILALQARFKLTSVAVTHDMASAFKIGNRIAMLHRGRIEEVGRPEELRNSKNEVVQQFIHGRAQGPIGLS